MLKKGTIFLVEDNPNDEKLTLRAIKKNNISHDIIIAHDGVEALNYIFGKKQYDGLDILGNIQLILLDLNLPKINGIEVLKKIKTNNKTKLLPVVVLTSSDEERDIDECYNLGANSYIQKTFDFDKFSETINLISIYWLQLNKIPKIIKIDNNS